MPLTPPGVIVSARYRTRASIRPPTKVIGVTPKRPLTERRAATHDRLIEAATKVVARRGFHAATVDEIADEAGFSVGALYSNFEGKDDLFLGVFDGHLRWYEERLGAAAGTADPRRVFSDWMDALMENPEQLLIFIEFWAYAVRKPKLRRTFATRLAEIRTAMARAIEERAAATGSDLPVPPETLALVLLAVGRGLGLEKLADADAVDDTVADLIAALLP
jgi:AcrR family transcriptional regulator